ncbi:hypothetical protein BSLG_008096 [Batrachochytrium salamandrivorans]|nr:hypothetical protein BSLG_008096 [Batrachochytrium salamandrivorans]
MPHEKKVTKAKDDDVELDREEDSPVSSFQSYAAEGDILAKQGNYRKAIEAYSKASHLIVSNGKKNILVSRSKCYLQLADAHAALADAHAALADADSALKEDRGFFKVLRYIEGVFQKAEALYSKGDFEMALVYYHRGNKLRPEFDEFRLGIQKAREAIDNSIGNPKNYKFLPPTGARLVVAVPTGKSGQDFPPRRNSGKVGATATGEWVTSKSQSSPVFSSSGEKGISKSEKSIKQLLGEMYADKEYLEEISNSKDFSNNPNDEIKGLVNNALKYLEIRTEFWRQQKPIYARKKENSKAVAKTINARNHQLLVSCAEEYHRRQTANYERNQNPKTTGGYHPKTAPTDIKNTNSPMRTISGPSTNSKDIQSIPRKTSNPLPTKMVDTCFKQIRQLMTHGENELALRRSKTLLTHLTDQHNLKENWRITGDLYDIFGSIYTHLASYPEALVFYKKELAVGREGKLHDIISRALGDMGRIYVKTHRYKDAIAIFEEKLSFMTDDPETRTWLLHDLGRCYLEIKGFEKAGDLGEASMILADSLNNDRWSLNARILVSQSQVQLKNYNRAIECYTAALDLATHLDDQQAINSIKLALQNLQSSTENKNNRENSGILSNQIMAPHQGHTDIDINSKADKNLH